MFYLAFRAVISLVLRLFFRLEPPVDPTGALTLEGPVIFVGNHPNGMVDPGLVFALARRHVTFLAKAPIFHLPVLGWILRGMDALPVYRKQDGADTAKNEGVLAASVDALVKGRAISIFPEGRSHSEPQLAELKTGCARIALDAAAKGAAVRIVPVGLTYSEKNRFRSRVRVDVGAPLEVRRFSDGAGAGSRDAVRALTEAIADALRAVTLNLERWEDLPIVETAEALYALEQGEQAGDPERQRAFARGLALLRDEQPERFERLKRQVASFGRRLELVQVRAKELTFGYRKRTVALFVLRNLVWLFGLPVFLGGVALFCVPYWIPPALVAAFRVQRDLQATVKVLVLTLLAPVWWALLAGLAFALLGVPWGVAALLGTPPLAFFTRYYFERRTAAWRDARVFLVLASREQLKARLLAEGRDLAAEIAALAEEYRPRVT